MIDSDSLTVQAWTEHCSRKLQEYRETRSMGEVEEPIRVQVIGEPDRFINPKDWKAAEAGKEERPCEVCQDQVSVTTRWGLQVCNECSKVLLSEERRHPVMDEEARQEHIANVFFVSLIAVVTLVCYILTPLLD